MSHQLNVLQTIFRDPISGNIHWREIESLLHHLGAAIQPIGGARFRVLINNVEGVVHHPHQGGVCNKQDIKHLREYLSRAGITPSLYETQKHKP